LNALERIYTRCLHKNAKEKKASRRKAQALLRFEIGQSRNFGRFPVHFEKVGPTRSPLKQAMTTGLMGDDSIRRKMKDSENTRKWRPSAVSAAQNAQRRVRFMDACRFPSSTK
jgi:hypothetical protein